MTLKKIILALALAVPAFAQYPQTPNLKMNLPPTGTQNWGPAVNYNFGILDTAVGALQDAYQGVWSNVQSYSKGQIVFYNGSSWMSLQMGNVNHAPAAGAFWGLLASSTGSNVPDPGVVNTAPVSNGTIYTLQAVLLAAQRAAMNGVASLDANTKVPIAQLYPCAAGAQHTPGIAPDPTTATGRFLKDDCTWAAPPTGVDPVGVTYQAQLKGTSGLTPGIIYDDTGLNALNAAAATAVVANYVDPLTVNDVYPQQDPWRGSQFSDFRRSYNDFITGRTLEVYGTSGISDWLNQDSGFGNFNNLSALHATITTQTPYQIGGGIVLDINQHAGNDAVASTFNVNCTFIDNRFNEGCKNDRKFFQFSETPFGGTVTSASADSLGNPIYHITETTGFSRLSAGEQRFIFDHNGAAAPAGNVTNVNFGYTDAGGKNRFVLLTVSADHGLGTSTITTLVGGADYKQYDTAGGSCPYSVISPTWPGNIDPYASPGVVDGSATKTQHQCIQVASGTGFAAGDKISLWDAGINNENTIIQSVYTSGGNTYFKVNLTRPHLANTLVVKGGGTGWGWQGQVDYNKTKYMWPIVATLDATHILLWVGSDVTDGPKLNSYIFPQLTANIPLTITPTVAGGVVTAIATNQSDYSIHASNVLVHYFPQPIITFGGSGSCATAPTFTWTFSNDLNGTYTPKLATGGTSCPPDLTITAQSTYTNPYYVWPMTRTARVIDPALWVALDKNSTRDQRVAASTSGYIVTDPWPASAAAVGHTLEIAPNSNRAMASRVEMNMEEATSLKNTSELWIGHMTSADAPIRSASNNAPAYLFIGRARNGGMPGPINSGLCPVEDDNNPASGPCWYPSDNQYNPGPAWGGYGMQSRGYYLNFPPLFDKAGSTYGAGLYVDCAADPNFPKIYHPCQSGVRSKYYSHFDKLTGGGMLYDQADYSYTARGEVRSDAGGFVANDNENTGFYLKRLSGGGTHWTRLYDFPFTSFGSELGQSDATISAGQYAAGDIIAGTGTPIAPLLFNVGTTGSTTYTYVVTALTANGESLPGPPFSVTNGPASSPLIVVKGTAIPGGTGYNIYRTAGPGGSGRICTNISPKNVGTGDITLTCNDTGQTAGAAPPSTNTTGRLMSNGHWSCLDNGDHCVSGGTTLLTGSVTLTASTTPEMGVCWSNTTTITGATVGHAVAASTADGSDADPYSIVTATVSATNTVKVQACAIAAHTFATTTTYTVSTY